ncbi:MAG TPA: UDP-3-O-(3-hydroxymyristoyl)glucosamine N-acyltransferase [Labilithrix sp.]|nr:UDP-3-O-(3-hydroxymyristoyl)glucosamine N-acyltransferase [Labilithrix sp.]
MRNRLERSVRASQLAAELGLEWEGEDVAIDNVTPLSAPAPHTLTFATRALPAELPEGSCVIARDKPPSGAWIRSPEPRLDFIKALLVLERLGPFARATEAAQIHPTAVIAPGVSIGKGVVIGEGTRVEPHVTIADDVRIGKDCWLKSGCVIGESGFGFERLPDGSPIRFLHFGGVIIGDRVEVGSVTTVVQGTLGPTVIEDDAKVDDHVHVAHNVRICKNAFVIACAELSGGVVVGEAAWIGPNASVLEKVQIGARAFVGLGCVVLKDVAPDTTVVGNPARVIPRRAT